jgi:hypothetical protein
MRLAVTLAIKLVMKLVMKTAGKLALKPAAKLAMMSFPAILLFGNSPRIVFFRLLATFRSSAWGTCHPPRRPRTGAGIGSLWEYARHASATSPLGGEFTRAAMH